MHAVARGVTVSASFLPASLEFDIGSNEHNPVEMAGTGNTDSDWEVVTNDDGSFDVFVRAERSGKGSGRVYAIVVTAKDDLGNPIASENAYVTVLHDKGKKGKKGIVPSLANAPNPFNASTQISYTLPEAGDVSLTIYSILGQPVRTLVRSHHEPGYYQVIWNGRDDAGYAVSSGIYIYRLMSDESVQTGRMLMLK
jgi:hypothetical protein